MSKNLSELGPVETVDDEVGGGIENNKISDKDISHPPSRGDEVPSLKRDSLTRSTKVADSFVFCLAFVPL